MYVPIWSLHVHPTDFRTVGGVILNTYSMKQPDLYCFETIKWRHKPGQILYGEYERRRVSSVNFD